MRLSLCLFPLLAACQSAATETPVSEPLPLERFIKIYDQNAAGRIGLEAMLDAAAKFEVVFFGETHLDETTHRLELAVYKGLIERTGGKVVLAMEMFDRGQQAELDAYLAGELAESEFIEKVRPWGNYRTGYRLLIETAKQRGLPVIGSNPPRGLLRKVGMKGPQALETLEPEERALLPEELHPNTDSYWDRFARRVRGHAGMVERMTPDQLLTSVQSYWDNSMGESCVRALKRHPDHLVLHINGGFHSQNREGAVTQLLARRPETRVAVIEALAVTDLAGFEDPRQPERADFLVAAESRARGLSEGYHAVTMAPELRYRLHMPEIATDKTPVPLLILLPDDGFRSRDGLATWWPALGKEAAVAVVEPPHLTLEDDLYTGGRWFFPDSFREDLGPLEGGLARIVDYIRRHYPVLEDRVVLAGEGSGSTIVAATALYASGLNVKTIAIAPRRYTGLRMLALPEKGPDRELKVLVPEADREWWETEAADYP
ncbi:MAG: ChaN family lipoprotein, partial [Planctomycetota bacterium]